MNNLSLILRTVRYGGTLDSLVHYGLSYSQIGVLVLQAVEMGLLEESEDGMRLTELGLSEAEQLSTVIGTGDDKVTIRPLDEKRTSRLNLSDVYLPAVKKSFFD